MTRVTLTFDNGPEAAVTNEVLGTLAQRGIRSTFFVIGEKFDTPDGRAATERAHDEGHWIANHSYTHSFSLGDSDDPNVFDDEVTRTQELLGDLAHPRPDVPAVLQRGPDRPEGVQARACSATHRRRLHLRHV